MTIADQLTLLGNTKTAIRDAIEAKGVAVGAIPFANYPGKIAQISSGGGGGSSQWQRPSDWLTVAPRAGAWIETPSRQHQMQCDPGRAPCGRVD